jgi:hypothetical protein
MQTLVLLLALNDTDSGPPPPEPEVARYIPRTKSTGTKNMYPRNAASPLRITIGPVVQISDGVAQTSGVTVSVLPQGSGSATAGAGTIEYIGGEVHYTPTQSETNHAAFTIIASKTGCYNASQYVVTTASANAGQVVVGINNDKVTAAEIRAAVGLASANLDTQLAGQVLAGSSMTAGLTVSSPNQSFTVRAVTQSGFPAPAVDLISGSSTIVAGSITSAFTGVRIEAGQHRVRADRIAAVTAISVHGNGTLALDVGIMQGGISLSESNANLFIRAQRMDGFTFAGPNTVNMRVEAGHINGIVESINNSNIIIRNAIISSDVACYEGVIELHDCIIRGNVTQSGTGVIRVTAGTQIFGNRIGNINLLPSDATSIVEALNELLVDQIFKRRGQITGDLTLQPGDELGLTFVEDPINVFDQLPKLDEELYWQINLPGGQTAPVTILSTPPE